jgi:chromosome segregation ATPase
MEHTDMHKNESLSEEIIDITREDISNIDEQAESVVVEDNPESSGPVIISTSLMPEIKGLELLKKAGSALNVGRTLKDMFSIIQSMETQLKKVLSINASLEKDLRASKELISDLKAQEAQLRQTIANYEEDIPSKRELQAGIDHLIEERNSAQPRIRDMKTEVENMQQKVSEQKGRITELEDEKADLIKEITFLEVRVGSAFKKISEYEKENNTLKGERLINLGKISSLEDKCRKGLDEKERLAEEIKESKEAIDEIHSRLAETKVRAKKSFYESDEESA